jgi:hypothetical protein
VESIVASITAEYLGYPRDERHKPARAGLQKLSTGLVVAASLFCSMSVSRLALASDEQVIVDGGERFVGSVRQGGHDVPLLRALEAVVPGNYSIMVPNAGPWTDMRVSWHAGSAAHVLSEILSVNPSLRAHIDSDLHVVTVTASARTERATLPPLLATATAPAPTPAAPATPAAQATPAAAATPAAPSTLLVSTPTPLEPPASSAVAPAASMEPPERTEWQMRATDGTVRNALARWASEAGWQFIWDVPTDFAVDATATIHGTLPEALRQVADALAGSQVPIQVVLYKRNRVMRVVAKGASS